MTDVAIEAVVGGEDTQAMAEKRLHYRSSPFCSPSLESEPFPGLIQIRRLA